jgi:putative membrane protein
MHFQIIKFSNYNMLQPLIKKNDGTAKWLIGVLSFVVFAAVVVLSRVKLEVNLGFNVHIFAAINAVINSIVSVLLILGLVAAKSGRYERHKRIMFAAIILSTIFLVSYIAHHLLASETKFGGVGGVRYFYFIILITHIFLAAVILPFILFTAYRALVAEWPVHRKIAKITWPIWFYVSVTGVIVYLLISPYYN